MGHLALLLCVIIVAQTARDIFKEIYPTKKEVIELREELSELQERYGKIDLEKLYAMRSDINAIKMSIPTPRRSR
jgi:hypothetical protein